MKKIIILLLLSLTLNCQTKKKKKKLVTKHDLAKKTKLHDCDGDIKWSDLETQAKYLAHLTYIDCLDKCETDSCKEICETIKQNKKLPIL